MSNFVTGVSHKSRRTAFVLCILGGIFGLHYFYVWRLEKGFLYMFTVGFLGLGWVFDIFLITIGRFQDQYGNYLVKW